MSSLGFGRDFKSQRQAITCGRCSLLYPKDEESCIHCASLSDIQLVRLKEEIRQSKLANRNIGFVFFILAIVAVIIFSFYWY